MSYSRWITSTWYTYWMSSNAHRRKDEQFACLAGLDHEHTFYWSYEMIIEFLEDRTRLEAVIQQCSAEDEEITELLGYMKTFIVDVDCTYEAKLSQIRGGQ